MRAHNVFFTADTHFGHTKMMINRAFRSLYEMDEHLIKRWNSVVKPKDEVWHLGDLSFYSPDKTLQILKRLNGTIHFVRGNHDSTSDKIKDAFASYQNYKFLKIRDNDLEIRQRIVLCHTAFHVWIESHHGSWNLHGHSHGNLKEREGFKQCDVGVDCWNLAPVEFEQIKQKFSSPFYQYFKSLDHHNHD